MRKILTLALVLMLALASLAPAALAESYTIGGIAVNVPDGMEVTRDDSMTTTVWYDDGTWYLPGYGVRVTLTDADCNILTATMPEDSPSPSRMGISWDMAVTTVSSAGGDMAFVPLDARDFPEFVVDFRVVEKADSLGDFTMKGLEPMALEACMLALVPDGVEYEAYETDTAVYCVYDWNIGNVDTRTYVTIHQGNIYEFEMRRMYSPITADDIGFAEMVVGAVEFE